MQGYNQGNYGGYGSRMPRMNGAGYGVNNYGGYPRYPQEPQRTDTHIYVTGRAGAEAFQLPPGVDIVELWDTNEDRLYIKGYDETGRPRILHDKDLVDHVEPVTQQAGDMSMYATKDDIRAMINEAMRGVKSTNMSGYVTQKDLNKALSELCVGSGGKVVRSNEHNA